MTLQRVESGFGNSSCSSMASFMSGLLQENFGGSEQVSFAQIQIEIVDDNAKVEIEKVHEISRSRSLVTMRRQRSGRQLSRWACSYERKDSDPNLMMRGTRRAPRGGGQTKLRATTSDSMLLNLPTRTTSPKLSTSGKTLLSTTVSSKSRLGNATWSHADVEKSTHRVERSQIFDLSLDISPVEQKSSLPPNPFLVDRLSSMSLIDERNCGLPVGSMEQKSEMVESTPVRCDPQSMESMGIRKPRRRPSVQRTTNGHHQDDEDNDATSLQPQYSKYKKISASAMEMAPVQKALNPMTLTGSSSSSLNQMTRIRDPSALGIQMPNRKKRTSKSTSELMPENPLPSTKQRSSNSKSASKSSSGMRRVSSSSKGLASFDDSLRRGSSKSLDSKKFLEDPSLVGLKV